MPSPPSATGSTMVWHSGHAACTPWAAASPASAEVRHPLKESRAITIFFINAVFYNFVMLRMTSCTITKVYTKFHFFFMQA
jgi:hypothetical protein